MFFLLRGLYFFVKGLLLTKEIVQDKVKEKIEHNKFKKNVDRELKEILNDEHRENSR